MNRRTKAVFAVVAVALMIVAVLPFFSNSSADLEPYQQQITYNSNNNSGENRTIIYDGIASSEYNPEYWEGTGYVPSPRNDLYVREVNPETGDLTGNYIKLDNGDKIVTNKSVFVYDGVNYTLYDPSIHATTYNWTGPSVSIPGLTMHVTVNAGVSGNIVLPSDLTVTAIDNATKTGLSYSGNIISFTGNDGVEFDLTVTLVTNKVFGGWNTRADGTGSKYLPGETLLDSVTSLYAQWITPDVFTNNSVTIASTDAGNVYCKPYFVPATTGDSNNKTIDFSNKSDYTQTHGDSRTYDSMYGVIYKLDRSLGNNKGQIAFNDNNNTFAGTYRSLSLSSKAVVLARDSGFTVDGDTIFDNVGISSPGSQGKHGGSTKGAIIAGGHILVMGTGIVNETLTEASTPLMSSYNNNNGGLGAPELFGGFASGTNTDTLVDHSPYAANYTEIVSEGVNKGEKTMVFADGTTGVYKISTCLIVHSGIYHTICGGGLGTIGNNNSKYFSTYASLRGGTSADATYGAANGTGGLYGDDDTMEYNENDYRKGGSFLYLTGHFFMAGDDWQDKMTGIYYSVYKRDCYKVWESSVATAATHTSTLRGSSHLFISGDASVWVANGASREEKGYTSCTMVDVSGSAVVRHVLAGATANANNSGDRTCFRSTWAFVHDNATVANALGGGYDIFNDPNKSTMKEGGTVNVVISGGTVGNVYGGGYRGSLGASGSTNVTVNVTVTGGTIEGNVYGGGSGGLDRAQHNLDGFKARDNSNTNSVGVSIIYGNVNVNVTGGTIEGNVYGGGMSVPAMYEYNSYTDAGVQKDHFTFATPSASVYVAAVYGKTNVNISGGEIGGSVYGGGEGLSVEKSENDNAVVSGDYSRVRVIKCFGGELSIDTIPWYKNGVYNYRTTNMYTLFKNYAKVDANGNATVVKISGDAFIGGGVFGGGNNGCVNGGRILGVDCSGQAAGKEYNVYNSVYGGSSTGDDKGNSIVAITNGKIRNSVFGGGFMGTTDGTTNVAVGYRINPQETIDQIEGTSIYIGDSVYAGADVKPGSGIPYSQALVLGDGFVYIYGRNSDITILGSIMGDGNSCLTKGWKEIQIEYFINSNQLTGIHRANKVSLTSSNIRISGREARIFDKVPMYALFYSDQHVPINSGSDITNHLNEGLYYLRSADSLEYIPFTIDDNTFYTWNEYGYDCNTTSDTKTDYTMLDKNAADFYDTLAACDDLYIGDTTGSNQLIKMASLFRIGKLTLQNGSYIAIDKPAEDVRAYESLNSRGNATSDIMPLNQIEFFTGGSFYVRKEMSADVSHYGIITGHTQLVVSEQGSYGAYVFGSTASTGGFVISKNGQYVYTSISDFAGDIRSWYIAGTEHKLITMSLPADADGTSINTVTSAIDLTILQENSNLRYTGGEYVPAHSGFEFVKPNNLGNDGKYSLEFAYPDSLTNKGDFFYNGTSLKCNHEQWYTVYYKTGENSYTAVTEANFDPAETMYLNPYSDREVILVSDGDNIIPSDEITKENIINYCAVTMDEGRYIFGGTYYGDGTTPLNYRALSKTDTDNGVYTFNVKFKGKSPQSTDYLGFIILDFEEYTVIQSGNEEFMMVVNTIEIRVDLYVEGYDDGKDIKYDLTLNAVYDNDGYSKGSADVLIQQSHNNYSAYVDKMTAYLYATPSQITERNVGLYVHSEEFRPATAEQIDGGAYLYVISNQEYVPATPAQINDGNLTKYTTIFVEATEGEIADGDVKKYVLTGNVPNLTISGIGNINNTNGWLEAYSREIHTGNNLNSKIGVLSGGYYATMRAAISSIETPDGLSYVVISSIRDTGDHTVSTIIFDISVKWRSYVTVTFHDDRFDVATEGEIHSAKILYVNDGGFREADTEEILAGTGLYVNDGGYRPATPEEIKGALFIHINANYVPATAAQIEDEGITKYIHKDGVTVKQFRYNYVMTPADCPSTTSNFSGWYYKDDQGDFTKIYNFNSMLTEDNTNLYARHMITVTYNYNNGVISTVMLNEEEGGTSVPLPSETPVRKGYTFDTWYTDPGCEHPWDDSKISTELTLYAKWTGNPVNVNFNGGYTGYKRIEYGSTLGDYLASEAREIANFQYWVYISMLPGTELYVNDGGFREATPEEILAGTGLYVNDGGYRPATPEEIQRVLIPIYYHTAIDENFIQWSMGMTIDLYPYCVVPAADDLHIQTKNDDSVPGYVGPDDEDVHVERYVDDAWIADLYQPNGGSYTGYYVVGNRDTVTWNTVTDFKAMYDSDKVKLIRNGDAYLNDGQSITVLNVTKGGTLRFGSNDAYYYDNINHTYEPVTSDSFINHTDLLDNLYENDHGNYHKVTLVKAGTEYTIYKYTFSNRASSTGYTFAGWHYGAYDEVSSTHNLTVWVKGDGKVYRIFDLSYDSGPIVEWQNGEEFENICLEYKASWQQMEFTVRTSNNAHGYITTWLEKLYVLDGGNYREATVAEINDDDVDKYIFNGLTPVKVTDSKYLTPLGDQFTVKYNGRVYIKFEGTDNYEIFQKWITIGGCTIDDITEPGTYMTVTSDCGFTATMTLNEQIIRVDITYGSSGRDLTESLKIYLVHEDGEYIPLNEYEDYRNKYIGFAGNGSYGVCIFANGSYYRIANVEITENRSTPIAINNVELIYITKELILPVNNLYDVTQAPEQYPQEDDEYTISGESGEMEAYVFVIGGYSFSQTGDTLNIDPITHQIELGAGHSVTVIYINEFDFYGGDHVQKTILIDMGKKKIYIIAKSDWIRQGDTWVPWDNENVGYVVYNMTEEELAHLTITWTDFSEFDTDTPGITNNSISFEWDDDSMAVRYSVIVVDGNVIVYKATSSTVSVDVINPLNRNIAVEPQQIVKNPLTIDDISEMAKAESASNIMAVIGHTMGRRA